MDDLVDLIAPSYGGTYFALVEFGIVKIGASSCISSRLVSVRASTFRRVALLAWTTIPDRQIHSRFERDRVTYSRDFFRLSEELFSFINECRVTLGFSFLEEVQTWDYGKPLPLGDPLDVDVLPQSWIIKLSVLPKSTQAAVLKLLRTERFRSDKRRALRDRVAEWISESDLELMEFLTPIESSALRSNSPSESSKVTPEELSRMGKYYTHLRWHKKPKSSCEFCNPPELPER